MLKRFFLVAGCGLFLAGCPSPYKQQQLEADVNALKRELAAIRAETRKGESDLALRTRLADLGAALEQLRTDISLLQGGLESMRDASSKRSDEQLKIRQDLEIRIAQLYEQLTQIQARIDALKAGGGGAAGTGTESASGAATPAPAMTPPGVVAHPPAPVPTAVRENVEAAIAAKEAAKKEETDQEVYQRGAMAMDGKRFADARVIYLDLITRFPKSEYADNARFWIGESYYREKDYASAILEYDKVVRDYPAGDKVPAALLKQGLAFLEIGEKEGGVATLQDLVRRYPKSDEAKKAKDRLAKLK